MLGGRVGAQVVVGGQVVDRFQHGGVVGQNSPAETPAGHAEELGEAVAHDGTGIAGQYGLDFGAVRLTVGQIKVGFVHDAPCAAAGGQLAHLVQYVEVDGGAGGVGRRRDHYGLGLACPVLAAQVGGQVEAGGGRGRNVDDPPLKGAHKFAVARVGGVGHNHIVTGVHGQRGGQQQGGRTAGGHADTLGVDVKVMTLAVEVGDGLAQFR